MSKYPQMSLGTLLSAWIALGAVMAVTAPKATRPPADPLFTGASVAQDVRDCVDTGRTIDYCRSIYVPAGKAMGAK